MKDERKDYHHFYLRSDAHKYTGQNRTHNNGEPLSEWYDDIQKSNESENINRLLHIHSMEDVRLYRYKLLAFQENS